MHGLGYQCKLFFMDHKYVTTITSQNAEKTYQTQYIMRMID